MQEQINHGQDKFLDNLSEVLARMARLLIKYEVLTEDYHNIKSTLQRIEAKIDMQNKPEEETP